MNFKTKLKRFLSNKKTIIALIIIVIIALIVAVKGKGGDENLYTLSSDSLAATGITVAGTVVAQEEVELSFQTSGRVASVPKGAGSRVSQGEVIASLNTGTLSANVLKAQADLDAEIAKLNEYKTQEGTGNTETQNKKSQLAREMQNAYAVSEDAIRIKTDQFFTDPESRFPKMRPLLSDAILRDKLNDDRYEVGVLLARWRNENIGISTDAYTEKVSTIKQNVATVQTYLNSLAQAVNKFESSDTYPQTLIDKYKSDFAVARTSLNNALSDLINAEEALRSTSSQIPYQEARVKSARAVVQNYQAELEKAVIRSPFAGLITRQDAKVGMSAMSDQGLVSVISDSKYSLEVYVPEVYISQIKMGNKAKVTSSSYGANVVFDATVTYIDPAASQRDGVASYKVELTFDQNDERIKSGMTADAEIMTEAVNPSFWIPVEAVIDQGGASYVKVKAGEATELRRVDVGERTIDKAEIKSGLLIGDQLVIEKK